MRRRLTALLAMVMLVMMLATSPAAFAQPRGSENSCGVSNPEIGAFPPTAANTNKDASGEFDDCGFRNNPNGTPPGHQE
jgi:hypothetical protein